MKRSLSENDIIKLKNRKLEVSILLPDKVPEMRFDRTGYIYQVTLDGKHTFCGSEIYGNFNGMRGGYGISGEFGIRKPVGFDEIGVGEKFPKIGVGLLKKQHETEYEFYKIHEADFFPIQIETEESKAVFTSDMVEYNGYSYKYTKTVTLEGNEINVHYFLENTGQKTIDTNEYSHNFICIDNNIIPRDCRLKLPYVFEYTQINDSLIVEGNSISCGTNIDNGYYYLQIPQVSYDKIHYWELIHLPTGVGLREYNDFVPCKFEVWGTRNVISPEAYCKIVIKPGQSHKWVRKFEFFE